MVKQSNIFITGKTGSGKTHLAIALLVEYGHYDPTKFRFENVPMLFNKIQDMLKEDENYIKIIYELQQINTLVLDDLGTGKNSEHKKETIYNLISERIFQNKQTIITTNMNLNQIKKEYDERLSSRLSEYYEIKLEGKDYRRKGNV